MMYWLYPTRYCMQAMFYSAYPIKLVKVLFCTVPPLDCHPLHKTVSIIWVDSNPVYFLMSQTSLVNAHGSWYMRNVYSKHLVPKKLICWGIFNCFKLIRLCIIDTLPFEIRRFLTQLDSIHFHCDPDGLRISYHGGCTQLAGYDCSR